MATTEIRQLLPRRGTAAAWATSNPVLGPGERGYETDTGKEKRGDGSTSWNSLPYLGTSGTDQTARDAAASAQATADAALPRSGGTMTGALVLPGDPVGAREAASRQYVLDRIAAVVGAAPAALDTLKEIADQLATDENAVAALTAVVAAKYTRPSGGIPAADLAPDVATKAQLDAVASLPPKIPPWASGLSYAQYQAVTRNGGTWLAQVAHTSGGIFEDDQTAGKWALLPVAATVADATRTAKGGVQLGIDGDLGPLGSTAAKPKVRRAGKRRPRLVFTHPSTPTIPASTLSGIPTVPYAPVILRAAGRLPNPIDNYYMYTSTDHDATAGGIWLLTAPTPLGPWTMQNGGSAVYVDAVQGNQTEVPSVEWDPLTEQVFLYYSNAATGSNQATQLATSVDGVVFERYGTLIATADLTNQPGNGHTGYFDATRLQDRLWIGTALRGGGGTSLQQLLWSRDGIAWVADPQPLLNQAQVGADNAWKIAFLRYFVLNGVVWASSREQQTGVSGASKSDGVLVAGPVTADFRQYDGPPDVVSTRVEATQLTEGEPKFFVDDDGTLYMSYVNNTTINVAYAEVIS